MVTIKLVEGISQKKEIGGIDYVGVGEIIEKKVVKRDNKWCVVHTHPPDVGKIIKCYSGKGAKEKAEKLHRAIMASKYKDLNNIELLEYSKFALVYESDDIIVECFKEIARRKEDKSLDWNLKIKNLPETACNIWKRIKVKLDNREVALIVLSPIGYERLKEYMKDKSLKNTMLPDKIKSIASTVRDMDSDRLIRLKDKLDISDSHEKLLLKVVDYELKSRQSKTTNCEIKKAVKLTKEEYNELLKKEDYANCPLDKKYYKDFKSGKGFCQFHIRGIEPEEVKKWESGELGFPKLIKGHSVHADIRLIVPGLKKMVQYVVVESDIESYIRMMKGEINPEQKNVQKAKIVSKPSGEPPKIRYKETRNGEMLIDDKGAKTIDKYIIHDRSYIIKRGEVGATSDKDAYMGLIWIGKFSEGVQREDFHEYFFYPDDKMPDTNIKLFDGKFVIRCFKGDKRPPSWMVWEATAKPYPLNPFCYCDQGFHYLIPAEDVKNFGHENYKEWKTREKDC